MVSACGSEGVQKAVDVADETDAIMAALARATDRTENLGSADAQAFNGAGGGSPASSMKGLEYAKNAEDLGEETVDVRSTTHCRARLDEAQLGKFKDACGDLDTLSGAVTGRAPDTHARGRRP
ncbi:hypothetical protein [Streptomyces griseorubiginosus]|uniref:hypothetical protein n=1 Tax=Streptomyces griseorubiginosus TaxID=67304 RepID=UPI00365BBC00